MRNIGYIPGLLYARRHIPYCIDKYLDNRISQLSNHVSQRPPKSGLRVSNESKYYKAWVNINIHLTSGISMLSSGCSPLKLELSLSLQLPRINRAVKRRQLRLNADLRGVLYIVVVLGGRCGT